MELIIEEEIQGEEEGSHWGGVGVIEAEELWIGDD